MRTSSGIEIKTVYDTPPDPDRIGRPGEYPYMVLGGESGGEDEVRRGRVPAGLIRDEVSYEELPEGVQARVLEAYRGMWGIEE